MDIVWCRKRGGLKNCCMAHGHRGDCRLQQDLTADEVLFMDRFTGEMKRRVWDQ